MIWLSLFYTFSNFERQSFLFVFKDSSKDIMCIVLLAIFRSCFQYTLINPVIHCMIITYINKQQCQDVSHGRQIYNVESVTLAIQDCNYNVFYYSGSW